MPIYRAQVTLPYVTNIPADVATNTLHFFSEFTIDEAGANDLASDVADFYRLNLTTGSIGIGSALLSNHFSRTANACQVSVFNLDHPTPRVPLTIYKFTLPPLAGAVATVSNMPAETAIVMSIFNEQVSGIPGARQRNRIYLGPVMAYGSTVGTGTVLPRVGSTQALMILDAAQGLWDRTSAGGIAQWVVYSATAKSAATAYEWPVKRIRVNDEYDTQRRRQPAVTAAWQQILWP